MRSVVIVYLCIILIMTGCGDNEDKPELESGNDGTDVVQETIRPTPTDTTLALDGYLAYTSDSSLFVLDNSTGSTDEVDRGVMNEYLYLSPDQSAVYYGVRNEMEHNTRIVEYEFKTGRKQDITTLPISGGTRAVWLMRYWSPNGEWAVIFSFLFSQEPILVNLQGESDPIVFARMPKRGWWTEDNQFVVVTQDTRNSDEIFSDVYLAPIETIELVDVETADISDITADVPLDEAYTEAQFLDVLAEAGYPIANAEEITAPQPHVVPEEGRFEQATASGRYCFTYQIIGTEGILFEQENVFDLDRLDVLDDGTVIFMQTAFPECSFLNGPTGEIVTLSPQGQTTIITDRLTSVEDRNNAFIFDLARRADVSPDESHLVFIAADDTGGNSLKVSQLPNGEAVQVMVDGAAIENVDAVVWGQ